MPQAALYLDDLASEEHTESQSELLVPLVPDEALYLGSSGEQVDGSELLVVLHDGRHHRDQTRCLIRQHIPPVLQAKPKNPCL